MSYLKLNNRCWDAIVDTGFGDRMQNWTYAYKLNEINDFNYTILADDYKWRELKYLDFPYTESGINVNSDNSVILNEESHPHKHIHGSKATLPSRSPELYFGRLTRHTHKGDSWMDSTKAKEVMDKDWFLDVGMEYDPDVISLIKLKDIVLEDKIKELVKDRIGIHIRHWPIDKDNFHGKSKVDRFDYKEKMKLVRETMDKYPNSKFYVSTNITYDKPLLGPWLPDFRKESHWISEIYRDYDVIDYRDIISVDNVISSTVNMIDENNPLWLKTKNFDGDGMQKEGFKSRLITDKDKKLKSEVNILDSIYNIKIKRDVVDLFSLIYSREFIDSRESGILSMWSQFVLLYRKGIKK